MRHGETKYQVTKSNILYSQKEQFTLSITPRFKKIIKEKAKKLKEKNIDLIYASDFYRTKQTAEIVAKELGLKIKLDKRLRDTDFGIFSGEPASKYKAMFFSKLQRFSKRPPKGESWRDVKKRVVSFLKEVDKRHKNKTILIVSHADSLWLLAGFLKGLTEKEMLEQKNPEGIWFDVGRIVFI